MKNVQLPGGRYYIGDLCYVLSGENYSQWDEVCEHICEGLDKDRHAGDGVFTLANGTTFASFSTAWGDGGYEDNDGRSYSVDAGIIGCVLASAPGVSQEDLDRTVSSGHGQLVDIPAAFTPFEKDGMICFGNIKINTDPQYEEEEDEY